MPETFAKETEHGFHAQKKSRTFRGKTQSKA
jgi:hypothetical protein